MPKNALIDDPHNPKVKFNVEKFNEFKYKTETCHVDVTDPREVEQAFKEQDDRAYNAILDKNTVKRSPYLAIIDLVVEKFTTKAASEVLHGK